MKTLTNTVSKKSIKPHSISISSLLNNKDKDSKEIITSQEPIQITEEQNESYTSDAFEQAWLAFARTIPKHVSVVSYINNNTPVRIDGHSYEITFSNVLQENEFKKLLTDLCSNVRGTLKNSAINFTTKVVETTIKDINRHPEEIFKQMVEQNPVLMTLKKNLNLEID